MTSRRKSDPLVAEIERALRPGEFIRYGETFEFVRGLEEVGVRLAALVDGGEAKRAVPLYEIFLSGCYEKMEECDDSGGNVRMFWGELFCGWVKARRQAEFPAAETFGMILKWRASDDYGLCYDIEKDVAKVLDRDGYRLFVDHFQATIDRGLAKLEDKQVRPIFEYENDVRLPALSLKSIYRAKGDAKSYSALCERLGVSPRDCENLAEMEAAVRRWDKALAWVERGLALEPARNWHNEGAYSLAQIRTKILGKLGRKEEALAAAWAEFEAGPSDIAYEELMDQVPKEERASWHVRALEVAARRDLGEFMKLCVQTREWERLAARVRAARHPELEAVSHHAAEPAAGALAKRDLSAAAKLYRALGLRILGSKKSKYYDHALRHFRKVRELYKQAGMESEWQGVVDAVRQGHSRKYGFMPAFDQVAAGGPAKSPSFAQRARARWANQTRKGTAP